MDLDDLISTDEESTRRCQEAHIMLTSILDGMKLDYGDTMTVLSKILCELAEDDLEIFMNKMAVAYLFYKAPDSTERSH
jgi:hypothetical protein